MKILVLGGTGALGAHLVDILAANGDTVKVTSRRQRPNRGLVSYVQGNAKDQAFLAQLLTEQWDVIVDFMVYTTLEFEGRIDMLLEATGHYLYLSSSRVYADSNGLINESTPRLLDVTQDVDYLATDEYALSKARQENLLFASKQANWTIVRPYISYSANRLQLGAQEKEDWLYRALTGRSIVTSSAIQESVTTLTYGADVASGMSALIGISEAHGQVFNITCPRSTPWSQILEVYLTVLEAHTGKRPKVRLQELHDFTRWRKAKYQIIYDRLYNRQFDNRKINRFIDTGKFMDPLDGVKKSLEEFLGNEPARFNSINWREEAIKDRMLNERIPLSNIEGHLNKMKYMLFRNFESAQLLMRD